MGATLKKGYGYLSGDYAAATDNLAPWVSECIARAIARNIGLPTGLTVLFIRALTRHRFGVFGEDELDQRWGQLMGSVVSFPVLCNANAAMCRWALEVAEGKPLQLKQCAMLINGDDCLLKTTKLGLDVWKRISAYGGLTPSVGKFYYSRAFANINSTNFVRRETSEILKDPLSGATREQWFNETKFINFGLLYGLKRSEEKVDVSSATDPTDGLGVRATELMRTCPESAGELVWKTFLRHHREVMEKVRVPWYMPLGWGGLGLPPFTTPSEPGEPVEFLNDWGPSALDLRVAARILECPERYPVAPPPRSVPWKTWQLAKTRLPEKANITNPSEAQQREYDALMGLLCVDVLLSHDDAKVDSARQSAIFALRKNEKSWHLAKNRGNLPPPLAFRTVSAGSPPQPILDVQLV